MHPTFRRQLARRQGLRSRRGSGKDRLNGGQRYPDQQVAPARDRRISFNSINPILGTEASAELRDRLVAELANVGSADDAAIWAHRNLRAKNDLTAADAQRVEEAFQARLATLPVGAGEPVQQTPTEELPRGPYPDEIANRPHSNVIDKSLLALPEPRRVRDRNHVKTVAKRPCLICGRQPADAHHLRFAQHRALGRKVSDEFTVPLCRGHHRELHRCGDEAEWWKKAGIDPTVGARALWLETHPLPICQSDAPADTGEARAGDQTKQVTRR